MASLNQWVAGARPRTLPAAIAPVILGTAAAHLLGRADLALAILASTFVHLHDLVNQIEQLKSQNGGQRVAEFLLGICETSEGPATIRLPYDKVVIAGLLGIKPESLSRAFARLRDFGVVIRGNELDIADVGILRSLASDSGAG